MDIIQTISLALIQGLTEFLPISSSAHLILVPVLLGWPDQGLAFDVAVHVGTLLAVLLYFRSEIVAMIAACVAWLTGRGASAESSLALAVILATLPVIIAGFVFKDVIEQSLRSPLVIATTTVLFAVLLWWADCVGRRERSEYQLNTLDIIVIGLSQALALIPGTSRSGVTITAALAMGLTREAAARFSFLLSIPTIAGAGLLKTKDLLEQSGAVDWGVIILGTVVAAVSAYACIYAFLKLLDAVGMLPFVIYRLLLGVVLFIVFL